MKCEYCNNAVPMGATRCPSCGAALSNNATLSQPQSVVVIQQPSGSALPSQTITSTMPQQNAYLLANQKSRAAYVIIGFLLGEFGIHNFYAGYTGRGIAQLLITILSFGLLFWVSWIWAVVEMLTVEKDAKGVPFK